MNTNVNHGQVEVLQKEASISKGLTYQELLNELSFSYVEEGQYFRVGNIASNEQTVIFISVILSQIPDAFKVILPWLKAKGFTFYIAKDKRAAKSFLNGTNGIEYLGKLVAILLPAGQASFPYIDELITLVKDFKGPHVAGSIKIADSLFTPVQQEHVVAYYNCKPQDLSGFPKKYKISSPLRENVKGNVYKALVYKWIFPYKFCVVKEGREHMWSDENGQDIRERLLWQKAIHAKLKGKVNIPEIIDYFECGGNSYLVMDFIQGKDLGSVIGETFNWTCWRTLRAEDREMLLKLLVKVLDMVKVLHHNQIVHRDLTPVNFILSRAAELHLIDLELAFDIERNYPTPPFGKGTFGFMSQEQINYETPTLKEDIYGLGGLMVVLFTNLYPAKFNQKNSRQLQKDLQFFIGDDQIAILISAMLNPDPSIRPTIETVEKVVAQYMARNKGQDNDLAFTESESRVNIDELNDLIKFGFKTLANIAGQNNNLTDIRVRGDGRASYNSTSMGNGLGLYSAVTGFLYLLSEFPDDCPANIKESWVSAFGSLPLDDLLSTANMPDTVLHGKAGVALTLMLATKAGVLDSNSIDADYYLSQCFENDGDELSLGWGIAGKGLVLLALPKSETDESYAKQKFYIEKVLNEQTADGSWNVNATGPGLGGKWGLINGISGIVMFLLQAYKTTPSQKISNAILKALNWILLNTDYHRRGYLSAGELSVYSDHSLATGTSGVVLTFLYAYQILNTAEYRSVVENTLLKLPAYPVWQNYSLDKGMSGLGLVYTEAARICEDTLWLDRAEWIVKIMGHSIASQNRGWSITGSEEFDPSLLTGNAGLLLFLLNYKKALSTSFSESTGQI